VLQKQQKNELVNPKIYESDLNDSADLGGGTAEFRQLCDWPKKLAAANNDHQMRADKKDQSLTEKVSLIDDGRTGFLFNRVPTGPRSQGIRGAMPTRLNDDIARRLRCHVQVVGIFTIHNGHLLTTGFS